MTPTVLTLLAVAAFVLVPAGALRAQAIPFTGVRTAEGIPAPAPDIARCGAPPNALIGGIVGTGTSSLGVFTTVESNCLNPITGSLFDGRFSFRFADGSTLFGTAAGTVVLPPVGGSTTNKFVYIVTGGTELFAGATGRLDVAGVVRFDPDGTTSNAFTYSGTINTVPEPSTLLLVGAGLAGVAVAARRRRANDGRR